MPSELTKFFQSYMSERLEPELKTLGLGLGHYTRKEKTMVFRDLKIRFDIYSFSRKRIFSFTIWELEIHNNRECCIYNVEKVRKILNFRWNPKICFFHVFSPYCADFKEEAKIVAKEIKKEYRRRFFYNQIDIKASFEDFEKIYRAFNSNRYRARKEYGLRLKREIGKIVTESVETLEKLA